MSVVIPAQERFWSRVNKNGPVPEWRSELGPCWIYTGGLSTTGYGQFHPSKYEQLTAHAFAYKTLVGSIPQGYDLDHLCRVRACVKITHLELVTRLENIRRGKLYRWATQLYCPHGHLWAKYTHICKDGTRQCLECARIASNMVYYANTYLSGRAWNENAL